MMTSDKEEGAPFGLAGVFRFRVFAVDTAVCIQYDGL